MVYIFKLLFVKNENNLLWSISDESYWMGDEEFDGVFVLVGVKVGVTVGVGVFDDVTVGVGVTYIKFCTTHPCESIIFIIMVSMMYGYRQLTGCNVI